MRRMGLLLVLVVACRASGADTAPVSQAFPRFLAALERNPRLGTAFDAVYQELMDSNRLPEFLAQSWQDAASGTSDVDWMLAGLLEFRRGRDAEAAIAFSNAVARRPRDAMASFYLAQVLAQQRNPVAAIESLEAALAITTVPGDRLEMFRLLARLHQARGDSEGVRRAWERLEQDFPGDPFVQAQIAQSLVESGDLEGALGRYRALADGARDPGKKFEYQREVALLQIRRGALDIGVEHLERLSEQVDSESWQFNAVRRDIEAVFLRRGNPAALSSYYEHWLKNHPDDLDALGRLARSLMARGRDAEARSWLQKGLLRAPSRRDLRQELIRSLLAQREFQAAADQFRELDRHHPRDPEILRDWGRALMHEAARRPQARDEAIAVWKRLEALRPQDPASLVQVADLFQHAGLPDESLALLRRCAALAPDDPHYAQILGEQLHAQGQTDQAIAVWKEMATGPRRTVETLMRVSQFCERAGRLDEAIDACEDAGRLDPDVFEIAIRLVDLLARSERPAAALAHLQQARQLARTDSQREEWVSRELTLLDQTGQLPARTDQVTQRLRDADIPVSSADDWFWLARSLEKQGQPVAARQAISEVLARQPESTGGLEMAVRLAEAQADFGSAERLLRQLITFDARHRSAHRRRLVTIYERQGDLNKALSLARVLSEEAPGNTELSEFLAQLCFRMGKPDEAVATLRRAVRTNPSDRNGQIGLGGALMHSGRVDDAFSVFWSVFDSSPTLQERLSITERLYEVCDSASRRERLVAELERRRDDPASRIELTFCLARVHQLNKDLISARRLLESLGPVSDREPERLARLAQIAAGLKDVRAAVSVQEQLLVITPSAAARNELVRLLLEAGDYARVRKLMAEANQPYCLTAEMLTQLDTLLEPERRLEFRDRLTVLQRDFPDNWELQYRDAAAHLQASPAEALPLFESVIRLNRPLEELSVRGHFVPLQAPVLPDLKLTAVELERQWPAIQSWFMAGPAATTVASGATAVPDSYGLARMGAWYGISRIDSSALDARFPELSAPRTRQDHIDRILVRRIQDRPDPCVAAARDFLSAFPDDREAQILVLTTLAARRQATLGRTLLPTGRVVSTPEARSPTPLSPEDLDRIVLVYRRIADSPELMPLLPILLGNVVAELVAADRVELAAELITDAVRRAPSGTALIRELFRDEFYDGQLKLTCLLLDRILELPPAADPTRSMTDFVAVRMIAQFRMDTPADATEAVLMRFIRIAARESDANRPTGSLFPESPGVLSSANGTNLPVNSVVINDPLPACLFSMRSRQMVSLLDARVRKAGRQAELLTLCQREGQRDSATPLERLCWKQLAAIVLWRDQPERSLMLFADALHETPDRQDLRLGLIKQYLQARQPSEALVQLNLLKLDTPGDRKASSLLRLSLAAQVSDPAEAQSAMDQLREQGLTARQFATLAVDCLNARVPEEAERVLLELQRQEALTAAQLRTLLVAQRAMGNRVAAATTALQILEQIDARSDAGPGRDGGSERASHEVARVFEKDCYDVLIETGRLPALIAEAEARWTASPQSVVTLRRLIRHHDAAGNAARVEELNRAWLALHATTPEGRYALALQYFDQDDRAGTQELLAQIQQQDPRLLGTRGRDTLFRLDQFPKRQLAFAQILVALGCGHTESDLREACALVTALKSRDNTAPLADTLFVSLWQKLPEQRLKLLAEFSEVHWWRLPEVHSTLASSVSPAQIPREEAQWLPLGMKAGTSRDMLWDRIVSEFDERSERDSLSRAVLSATRRLPEWKAGPVLVALLDLKDIGRDSAKTTQVGSRLAGFLEKHRTELLKVPQVAQQIGLGLIPFPETVDLGIEFLKLVDPQAAPRQALGDGGVALRICDAYQAHGRNKEIRTQLLAMLPAWMSDSHRMAPSGDAAAEMLAISRVLRARQFPVDAIVLNLQLMEKLDTVTWGLEIGREVQLDLANQFGELQPAELIRFLESSDGTSPLVIHASVRQSPPGAGRMQCRWEPMLRQLAGVPADAQRALVALEALDRRDTSSTAALQLAVRLARRSGDQARAVSLSGLLRTRMGGQERPGRFRVAADRQLTESVAAWVVARDCLKDSELRATGVWLAEHALASSRLTRGDAFELAILEEWIAIARDEGDHQTVERLTSQREAVQ